MAFSGKLFGFFIGLYYGGFGGSLFGLLIGSYFDQMRSGQSHGRRRSGAGYAGFDPFQFVRSATNTASVQALFFDATFSIMGYVAKSDGRVSEKEIAKVEQIMLRSNLHGERRQHRRSIALDAGPGELHKATLGRVGAVKTVRDLREADATDRRRGVQYPTLEARAKRLRARALPIDHRAAVQSEPTHRPARRLGHPEARGALVQSLRTARRRGAPRPLRVPAAPAAVARPAGLLGCFSYRRHAARRRRLRGRGGLRPAAPRCEGGARGGR